MMKNKSAKSKSLHVMNISNEESADHGKESDILSIRLKHARVNRLKRENSLECSALLDMRRRIVLRRAPDHARLQRKLHIGLRDDFKRQRHRIFLHAPRIDSADR